MKMKKNFLILLMICATTLSMVRANENFFDDENKRILFGPLVVLTASLLFEVASEISKANINEVNFGKYCPQTDDDAEFSSHFKKLSISDGLMDLSSDDD